MLSSNNNTNEITSAIEVMRMQEAAYHSSDCLYQEQVDKPIANGPLPTTSCADADCRSKMAQWCYQIIDFCKFNRETVSIAMNYLDRFLMTEPGRRALASRKVYQLASMTCLYTAVKLHEPEAMDPNLVSSLSHGMYSESQITEMELVILNALKWRVNPPTTMSFVRHFFNLLPSSMMSEQQAQTALEIARFQSELAVCNYDFVRVKDSTIAYACVANALEHVQCQEFLRTSFLESIAKVAAIDKNSMQMNGVQTVLYNNCDVKACSDFSQSPRSSAKAVEGCGSVHVSPRSVAGRA